MARITTTLVSALLSLSLAAVVQADTLSIINEPNGVERPHRGMNMEQVRGKFGPANEEIGPVGEPPISRWVYDDFTVYYEHQYVIHAVAHKHNGLIGPPATAGRPSTISAPSTADAPAGSLYTGEGPIYQGLD